MNVDTGLTGFFPRSEELIQATRDLDRGRLAPEAVESLTRSSEGTIAALELKLGLEPITAGSLRWADIFRPIAESWGGFTVGPVTRWFETNTFFRQPILDRPPERTAGAIARLLPGATGAAPAGRAKVLLPGPYTLAGLLDNRSGETSEALVHRLGRLLAEEVADLLGQGYRSFQFQEPLAVVRPPTGPTAESVVAAYRAIVAAAPGATTTVWTFFADATPALPLLARLKVSIIGIDLAETDPAGLPHLPLGAGLGIGCVDPRTTLGEDPETIASLARVAAERLQADRLFLGPGGPLDLLPFAPAARKLGVLPLARSALARSAP
ncbi:MAG: hypothetical protein ACYDFT_02170 [Thermoplasmata archaeon]